MGFLKRFKKDKMKKQGEDTVVSSQDLLNEEGEGAAEEQEQEVFTELSLPPTMNTTSEQQYVLRFLNNELPPLKPNQISLAGIERRMENGKLIVSAFIRNSLSKNISLKETPILFIGPNDERLARKEFDLSKVGEIPAKSSRPWNFEFRSKDMLSDAEIPDEGWKLAFELKTSTEHKLELDKSWEESLAESERVKLEDMVKRLEPPKKGEVNFLGIQARINKEGGLSVSMLIRNGNDKNINLQQLPLQVEDASGEVVASGGFKLGEFEVKANTSKPWTFIFPKGLVKKEDIDLSKWKVQVVQK
jgi:accessory Sec system S-layer assembly protein